MDNEKLRERLSAFFDNELPEAERAEVEKLLAELPDAREILAQFKQLDQMGQSGILAPAEDYWEKQAAKIDRAISNLPQSTPKVTDISWWNAYGWKALSVAASIVLLTYIGFHQSEIVDRSLEEEASKIDAPIIDDSMVEEERRELPAKGQEEDQFEQGSGSDDKDKIVELEADEDLPALSDLQLDGISLPELESGGIDIVTESKVGRSVRNSLPKPALLPEVSTPREDFSESMVGSDISKTISIPAAVDETVLADLGSEANSSRYWELFESEIIPLLEESRSKGRANYERSTSLGQSLVAGLTKEKSEKKAGQPVNSSVADSVEAVDERQRLDAAYFVALEGDSTQVSQALAYLELRSGEGNEVEKSYARELLKRYSLRKSQK